MSPEEHQPIKLFYVYAREDELLHKELEKHLALLQRQGFIESWYDRQILPGMEWKIEIEKQLTSARIIVLLISADFFYSDYGYSTEMKCALQQHELGKAWVLPVILRSVDWKEAPFAHLQCLPRDGRPITTWSNRDEAFLSVAQGIRDVVNQLRTDPPLVKEQSKREQSEEALDTKERWLEEGNDLYSAANYEGALVAYDRALLLDSHLSYAYIRKGHSFGRLRRFKEALSACEQALHIDPYNAYAHSTKSAALNKLGRLEEAMIACHEALRLDPYSAHAYSVKAGVLISLKRNQEALDACNQALLLDSNDATAHGNAAAALIGLGRLQEAWKAIERSFQLDPDNAAAYVNRGQVFLNFNHYQQAITAYDQALRLDPDNSIAYIGRGLAYMKLDCFGAALSSIEESLRRDPSSPTAPIAHGLRMEILRYLRHR